MNHSSFCLSSLLLMFSSLFASLLFGNSSISGDKSDKLNTINHENDYANYQAGISHVNNPVEIILPASELQIDLSHPDGKPRLILKSFALEN